MNAKQLSSKLKKAGSVFVTPEKIQEDCRDFQLDSKKIKPEEFTANLIKQKKEN